MGDARAIRFAPPAVAAGPELRYVLSRAFGARGVLDAPDAPDALDESAAADSPPAPPLDGELAVALARRLGLAARLATRAGAVEIERTLGPEAVRELTTDRRAAAASSLRTEGTIHAVALASRTNGPELPIAFLKAAALELTGRLTAGSRAASDVDVLAPFGRAEELQRRLIAAGFATVGAGYEHQLPALVHPQLGAVEVHRLILGVRVAGERSATFDDLAAGGLLAPVAAVHGAAVPKPEVLAAHAVVHAVAQHGWEPAAYPFFRLFADLLDLAPDDAERRALLDRARDFLARDVSSAEIDAVADLCADLAAARWPVAGGAATLFAHALAGRLDEDYERALKARFFAPRPTDRSPLNRAARTTAGALFPSAAELDAIYAPPGRALGAWRRWGYRIARPFDLARRYLRSRRTANDPR